MKKVYIIATSVGSTVSIKTTTDKEVVFRTIKEHSGRFINEIEYLESAEKYKAEKILHFKQIPTSFCSFAKACDEEENISQSIGLLIDRDHVLFKVERRNEDGISVLIHTYCPQELLEEENND